MDRSLLERMIGATVLVILLVMLAPALLDGTQSEGRSSDSSDIDILGTAEQQAPVRIATIRLNSAPPDAPPTKAQVKKKKPVPAVVQSPKSAPAAAKPSVTQPTAGQWVVQLGSFSGKTNAETYAAKLKSAGFPALVRSFRSGGKTMYRVQVGPRDDRVGAEKLVTALKKAGYKGVVMPVKS